MLFAVTIWANKLQVVKAVIASVSVFVMNLQYFKFIIPASFALLTPFF